MVTRLSEGKPSSAQKRSVLLQKGGEVEEHHRDDDNGAYDGPNGVEPFIVFFVAEEKHVFVS